MSRSVTYSVVPRRNPRDKDASPKYYAQAQARGDMSLRDMADRIQSTCTVHKSDVYAVLVALEDVVAEAIQNGEIVRLGDLCTLQVSLSGKGALTEEDFDIEKNLGFTYKKSYLGYYWWPLPHGFVPPEE
jgi:predicted histone-like DNA-binding protein